MGYTRNDIIDLAGAIYPILRQVAARREATVHKANISYSDLCGHLAGRWQGLHYRDPLLNAALGHLVDRCRAAKLPAISSVVINYGKGRPGNAYFLVAHPEAGSDPDVRLLAWGQECTAAHTTDYPAAMP